MVETMGKFTDGIKRLFRRRRAITPAEAEDLSSWVNEGGSFDPEGPPPVRDEREPKKDQKDP